MKNWKTTTSGILAALPSLLAAFGVAVPKEAADGLLAVGLFLMGLFSKDMNVTGGTVSQTPQK